jgi:hypothetical protein
MDHDGFVTDIIGVAVIITGLLSLIESVLQVRLIGSTLPMVQGTLISLFTVSFGVILLTEGATEAFKQIRLRSREIINNR